ncbi:MAG: hypothetical protein MUE41_01975 [Gemmatimonadaceae bacterium]|jgi:hypothetical protein|nr:hypothetical protein [Gemmatimonadaceae bacterium]
MPSALRALVEQRTGAYFAGLSHLNEEAQLAAIRRVMGQDVDRLEVELLAQVELVRDCLLMAANSMQDARLALLERELAKVQHPAPKQVGEFVVEAVLILAGELAIVLLPYLGATAVAATLAPLALTTADAVRKGRAQLRGFEETRAHLATQSESLWSQVTALSKQSVVVQQAHDEAGAALARTAADAAPEQLYGRVDQLMSTQGLIDDIDDKLRETRTQLRAAEEAALPEVEKMVAAFVTNDAVTTSPVAKLGAKMRATTDSRIGQTLGAVIASPRSPSGDSSAGATDTVFFTSDVLGEQLDACRARAAQVRLAMAAFRRMVADVTWNELLEEPTWQQRMVDLCTIPALLSTERAASRRSLPALVRSAEVVLWYEWLSVTGALTVDTTATYTHTIKAFGTGSPGTPAPDRVVGPYWIFEPMGEQRGDGSAGVHSVIQQDYAAQYLPGLAILTEAQAAYLYERFARALVTSDAGLPFSLADTDFSQISRLAPTNFFGGTNDAREQLIARQKIIVIAAFQQIGVRLASAIDRVASTSSSYASDDLQVPFTLLDEPDGTTDATAPVDPIAEWSTLRSDAMLAARALRDGIRLHESLRAQIDAMPAEPAAARMTFERQRTQVVEQIARDKATVARTITRAKELGSAEQLVRDLNVGIAPDTIDALQRWQATSTRPRFSTMPGVFTE